MRLEGGFSPGFGFSQVFCASRRWGSGAGVGRAGLMGLLLGCWGAERLHLKCFFLFPLFLHFLAFSWMQWKKQNAGVQPFSLSATTWKEGVVRGGLVSQVTSDRTRGSGLKLHQGRFRLDIRKNFFTERTSSLRVMEPWRRLPRGAVESPSLEIFQTHLNTVLCPLLWVTLLGQGVGLDDPQRSLPTPNVLWFCERVVQAAQGGGGVPIPGGTQKMCRCGTSGHGGDGLTVGLHDLRGLFQP